MSTRKMTLLVMFRVLLGKSQHLSLVLYMNLGDSCIFVGNLSQQIHQIYGKFQDILLTVETGSVLVKYLPVMRHEFSPNPHTI